jgi:hypothetical protein
MPDNELKIIAAKANFIVNGYAFTERDDGFVSILNLEHPECAMVVDHNGELIETNMDAIEQTIVLNLCKKNLQFLEVQDA